MLSKIRTGWILFALCICVVSCICSIEAKAASGVIEFTTANSEQIKGEEFTVVCQLTSSEAFLDVSFDIVYDSDVLRFVSGGKKVSGGNGVLHVESTGNDTASYKKTFSLQFVAAKKGDTVLAVNGAIQVLGEDGTAFSISSNQLLLSVINKKAKVQSTKEPKETKKPKATEKPKKTKEPAKKTQVPEPTKVPKEESGEKEKKDIAFGVTLDGQTITIKNSYEFEVLDPSGLENVPAGYIQTSIDLDGVKVPTFTLESDLDNNYLLLYLKGPSGNSTLYQYDREEKTLQRYTGDLVKRANQGAYQSRNNEQDSVSNYILFGIIAVLIILILCMLITMLKMAMKKKDVF